MPLLGAVLLTFGLQLTTIYVPQLNPIFRTAPLTLPELAACLLVSAVVFGLIEIRSVSSGATKHVTVRDHKPSVPIRIF